MAYKQSNTKKIDPIKPSCTKTIYNSYEDAMDMIKYLRENKTGKEITAYKCTVCGFWHLTSKGGR